MDSFEMLQIANEVLDGRDDTMLVDIVAEVRELVRRHAGPSCGNEVLAQIASEAFFDACDAWHVRNAEQHFAEHFPTLALEVL